MALYREHVGKPLPLDGAVFSMWFLNAGLAQRSAEEMLRFLPDSGTLRQGRTGRMADGTIATIRVVASDSPAANPAFDVTPSRLVTGLITERGRCDASAEGLLGLFPEHRA
jgi:methylthioribose-1-phosphate isomerase